MKPQRHFVADRPLARHCPELLRPGRPPADPLAQLARLGERTAPALARSLARVSGGAAPKVTVGVPLRCTFAELAATIAPLAANTLFALDAGKAHALVSVEAEAVFRLFDRAFGGRGDTPADLPETFPLSTELFLSRIEAALAEALAAAIDGAPAPRTAMRHSSIDGIGPVPGGDALAAVCFEVANEDGAPWSVTLAVPVSAFAGLLGEGEQPTAPAGRKPGIAEAPFAEIPLTLRAVLVDMAMPFSRLAALRPGDVIPVSVARTVPIAAGEATVAHGTVGALDDRVAVQVTRAF